MSKTNFIQLCEQAKQNINEVDAATAYQWKIDANVDCIIIDVREDRERMQYHIQDSIHLSRGTIECHIEKYASDRQTRIVLHCSGGFRSALAAESLQKMGYTNVYSMTGGLQDWVSNGHPIEQSD